jgi:cellulose synthase/poly-beta-1,6-N-acetylglucosamine synthase-like glycosyltransferase
VQGVYLFRDARAAGRCPSISSLALLVKNLIRPLGLYHLGLPCLLNGSGSAYPFALLRRARHGQGSIAEDYQLAVDLALAGAPPRFCPAAEVHSSLPGRKAGAWRQRRRWEHGHLQLVFVTAPRLLATACARRSAGLAALALELAVPPLSFLVLAWCLAAAAAAWAGSPLALRLALASGGLLFLSVVAGWVRFLGAIETLRAIIRVPLYVASKVPLYLAFLTRREKRWTKTPRDRDAAA